MSFNVLLKNSWKRSKSLVCVGLDTDLEKIPISLKKRNTKKENNSILEFNKAIITATAEQVCAFKINIAFYSAIAAEKELEKTISFIHENYPGVVVILDSKRGDIGNTAEQYVKEAYTRYKADACTISPYMGTDSVDPFLKQKNKGAILLCRTSNAGGKDIQEFSNNGKPLYQHVAELAATKWNYNQNVSLVVGATYPKELKEVRAIVGNDIPLLVPGVGSQGGDVAAVIANGKSADGLGLVINVSRSVIYASSQDDFAIAAKNEVIRLNKEIGLS